MNFRKISGCIAGSIKDEDRRSPKDQSTLHRLPFQLEPPVRTYLHTAFPLGIICRNGRQLTGPALNYHVQLFFPNAKLDPGSGDRLHFKFIPDLCAWHLAKLGYLEIRTIFEATSGWQECADSFVQKLLSGSYLHLWVDEFFIPNTASFKRRHVRHTLLLIGYDPKENAFVGVTYLRTGSLAEVLIPKDSLVASLNLNQCGLSIPSGAKQVEEIVPTASPPNVSNRSLILAQLDDYLQGVNNAREYELGGKYALPGGSGLPMDDTLGAYGIGTYSALCSYMNVRSAKKVYIDLRVTRLLWEHKKMLLEILVQGAMGPVPESVIRSFREVVAATHKIHLRALQLTLRRLPEYFGFLAPLLNEVKDKEQRTLASVLELSAFNKMTKD